jgi:hypothetical protein
VGINSKQKGNSFERIVANRLSEVFEDYYGKKQSFYRNANSGAFFGGKNQFRTETHLEEHQDFGDIITPKDFRFTIECKAYKTPPSFKSIIEGKVTQWDTWLEQAETDAENAKKQPLLIVKYNNCPIIVFSKIYYELEIVSLYKDYFIYQFEEFLKIGEDLL